jgi:hypothetical protein
LAQPTAMIGLGHCCPPRLPPVRLRRYSQARLEIGSDATGMIAAVRQYSIASMRLFVAFFPEVDCGQSPFSDLRPTIKRSVTGARSTQRRLCFIRDAFMETGK